MKEYDVHTEWPPGPVCHCLFCGGEFTDGVPGTSTVMVQKGSKGVWYGAHDACLREVAHPDAPLTPLND